jgi:hypothetical protein
MMMDFDIPGNVPAEPEIKKSQPKLSYGLAKSKKEEAPVVVEHTPASNYGGTVVLHDHGNETMLDDQVSEVLMDMKLNAHLIRLSTNEIVPIKGTLFQLGSDYEYSDYQVRNNKTVSSTHARIIVRQKEYYILDMNSKNHTYVDDKVIPSMVETKLNHGTRVRLGSEKFVFNLY